MSLNVQENDWVSRPQVRVMTGWSIRYIEKLRVAGVLEFWRPYPGAQFKYRRSQVAELIKPTRPTPAPQTAAAAAAIGTTISVGQKVKEHRTS